MSKTRIIITLELVGSPEDSGFHEKVCNHLENLIDDGILKYETTDLTEDRAPARPYYSRI